jgi:hypothetical protein
MQQQCLQQHCGSHSGKEQAYTAAVACIADACKLAFSFLRDNLAANQGAVARMAVPQQVAQSGLLPLLESAMLQLAEHLDASAGDNAQVLLYHAAAAAGSGSSCCTTHMHAKSSSKHGSPYSSNNSSNGREPA